MKEREREREPGDEIGQTQIKKYGLFFFWLKKCQDLNIFFCDRCFQNAISKLMLNKPKYFKSKEVQVPLIYLKFK